MKKLITAFVMLFSVVALGQRPAPTPTPAAPKAEQIPVPVVVKPRVANPVARPQVNNRNLNVMVNRNQPLLRGGDEGTGGGDPIAAEFSNLALYVSEYLNDNPQVFAKTSREAVKGLTHDIGEALEINSKGGRVEVVDRDVVNQSPFLASSTNPLQITISRSKWNALNARQRLDQVTKLLVQLSVVTQEESIPLPADSAARYLDTMSACVISLEHTTNAFDKYSGYMKKCVAALPAQRSLFVPVIKASIEYLKKVNELCQEYCRTPQQTFVAAGACQAYVDSYEANQPRLAKIVPECVSL